MHHVGFGFRSTRQGRSAAYSSAHGASSTGFLAVVALCLAGVFGFAILIGQGFLDVSESPILTTGLAAGAVVLVLSAGLIAAVRHITSGGPGNLDLALLMILVGIGWLVPLRLIGSAGLGQNSWLGSVALGTAVSVLIMTAVVALEHKPLIRLNKIGLAIVAVLPTSVTLAASAITTKQITDETLRTVGIAILGLAACVGLIFGLTRHRWLLAFVGLQMLGIQGSEILGIEGRAGSNEWIVGAGMMAFAAGAIGLYGVAIDIRQTSIEQEAKLSDTLDRLKSARQIALEERLANQDRLHSLRSGLLAVEALVSLSPENAEQPDVVAMEVRRLKELTKSSALTRTAFDLAPQLRRLVEMQHRLGVAVTLDAHERLPVFASQDATVDALHSLIHNATRHAPGQPVVVSAHYSVDSTDTFLDVSVSDRGPGVKPKLQDKIFTRGVTTHAEGTGLGLALARQVAESQGGGLQYKDRLGGGAEFVMRIVACQPVSLSPQMEEAT